MAHDRTDVAIAVLPAVVTAHPELWSDLDATAATQIAVESFLIADALLAEE